MRLFILFLTGLLVSDAAATPASNPDVLAKGKAAYDYYCYQCHAYAGTGQTLAAHYLEPPPRDFTSADPQTLTRDRMLDAVTSGRANTGMKSFSRVLDAEDREAVVEYIRDEFMSGRKAPGKYHTEPNGWPDHEQKYSPAYPFVNGEIAIDTPPEELGDLERKGLDMFYSACISCHDRAKILKEGEIWRARSSSYPRRHYDHRIGPWDAETSATPYQRHDVPPDVSAEAPNIQAGQAVFLENCAFCHAADGTGKNWIGSFTEPPAADLTGPRIAGLSREALGAIIKSGIPGSTMPAWRGILEDEQFDRLLDYLLHSVQGSGDQSEDAFTSLRSEATDSPVWQRQPR